MPRNTIAYQGVPGAYSQAAALSMFSQNALTLPCESFSALAGAIHTGKARLGILPVENSIYGIVADSWDIFLRYPLLAWGELYFSIDHYLLANTGVPFASIKKIFSHPQALGQCSRFLQRCKGVNPVPVFDTAGAVEFLRLPENRSDSAIIAGKPVAKLHNLAILKKSVQNSRKNLTRFLLLSKTAGPKSNGKSKLSLLVVPHGKKTRLAPLFTGLQGEGMELLTLHSRPLPGSPFHYAYFADITLKSGNVSLQPLLSRITESGADARVLGVYPKGPSLC